MCRTIMLTNTVSVPPTKLDEFNGLIRNVKPLKAPRYT